MRNIHYFIIPLLVLLSNISAQELSSDSTETSLMDKFIDNDDGYFDVSEFLGEVYGFLPTPIIITGPTFGYGGGMNLMFLHDKFANNSVEDGRYIPPSMSGIAYAQTENGTSFGALYHIGFWMQDTLRTTTFVGNPSANLDFHPDLPIVGEKDITMNLEGWVAYQELKYRLGDSNFFIGGNYLYFDIKSSTKESLIPILDEWLQKDYTTAALAAVVEYDSRDSIFTPDKGLYAKLVAARYDEAFGSDFEYWNYRGKFFYFQPLFESITLGLRAEAQSVDGTAPYYMYPSVDIRGIAHARYQGQHTAVAETEVKWSVTNRWGLIGFIGSGKAFGEDLVGHDIGFLDASWNTSYGAGFRYNIAKKFKLKMGLDFAVGPEENSVYITAGHAWDAFF